MATTKSEPEAEHNLDGYGAPLIPWTKIRERLERGFTQVPGSGGPDRHTCWLATVHPDGKPACHAAGSQLHGGHPVLQYWGKHRKAKNLVSTRMCHHRRHSRFRHCCGRPRRRR